MAASDKMTRQGGLLAVGAIAVGLLAALSYGAHLLGAQEQWILSSWAVAALFLSAFCAWAAPRRKGNGGALAGPLTAAQLSGAAAAPARMGAALSAEALSGVWLIGAVGALFVSGAEALAFGLGWVGGLALASALFAPFLRGAGAYGLAGFLGARFGGPTRRLAGLVCWLCAAFFLAAQIAAAGAATSYLLGLEAKAAAFAAACALLAGAALSGFRAPQSAQRARLAIMALGFALTLGGLYAVGFGLAQGGLAEAHGVSFEALSALEERLDVPSFGRTDSFWGLASLAFCLSLGVAAAPQHLTRACSAPSARVARASFAWAAAISALAFVGALAMAYILRIYWLEPYVDGASFWGSAPAENMIALAASEAILGGKLLLALLAMAAFMAAAAGAEACFAAISEALGRDGGEETPLGFMSPRNRPALANALGVLTAGASAVWIGAHPLSVVDLAAWGASIAASSLFPVLLLGVWWARATGPGALLGGGLGLLAALGYIIAVAFFEAPKILGVATQAAAVFGAPVGFIGVILGSYLSSPPNWETREAIERFRVPRYSA